MFVMQISVPHNESNKVARGGLHDMTLVEVCSNTHSSLGCWVVFNVIENLGIVYLQVGPRFCLNPIKIFGGSFGGPTLYENPLYISPNQVAFAFQLSFGLSFKFSVSLNL